MMEQNTAVREEIGLNTENSDNFFSVDEQSFRNLNDAQNHLINALNLLRKVFSNVKALELENVNKMLKEIIGNLSLMINDGNSTSIQKVIYVLEEEVRKHRIRIQINKMKEAEKRLKEAKEILEEVLSELDGDEKFFKEYQDLYDIVSAISALIEYDSDYTYYPLGYVASSIESTLNST